MSNPRRRRSIVMVMTLLIVAIVQIPNLLNILGAWERPRPVETAAQIRDKLEEFNRAGQAKGLSGSDRAREQREFMDARSAPLNWPSARMRNKRSGRSSC